MFEAKMSAGSALETGVTGGPQGALLAQRLLAPDRRVNAVPLMFARADGAAGWDTESEVYFAQAGAGLRFNAWFNVFDATPYDLDPKDRIVLRLRATGDFVLAIAATRPEGGRSLLVRTRVSATGEPISITLPARAKGLISFDVTASSPTEIHAADWLIRGPRRNRVKLRLVITTFRRDREVQATARRLQTWLDANPDLAPAIDLTVVDNGGETDAVPFRQGRVLKNRNLGGAGGFTRGLLEARRDPEATHVLFMDDDAEFFPENLRRTVAVLAKSRKPEAALAASMIPTAGRHMIWENTSTFEKLCRPIDKGLDLRKWASIKQAALPKTAISHRYAGWWYFCFPLAAVKRLPFPFFVRGDDVHFSLANPFEIRTMAGLSSHQDDFVSKRSPTTAYLDARYHIVQLLSHATLDGSAAKMENQLRFLFNQWNNTYHYGSAQAVMMAMEDVASGPGFWDEDPEMARGRARLKEIAGDEYPGPLDPAEVERATEIDPLRHTSAAYQRLRWLTANGHRLPDRVFYSRDARFPLIGRFGQNEVFMRRRVFVADAAGRTGYKLAVDRKRFFENRRRFAERWTALKAKLPELRAYYGADEVPLLSEKAWRERLGL